MPKCLTRNQIPQREAYSINVAVAGYRGIPRLLTVRSKRAAARSIPLPVKKVARASLTSRIRRLAGGVGCIVIRSFGDPGTINAFDTTRWRFSGTLPGLIIDVRRNGGGDTAIARPIMGRFITELKCHTPACGDGKGQG